MIIASNGFQSHKHAWLSTLVFTIVFFLVVLVGCDRPDRGFMLPVTDTYSSRVDRSRIPIPLPGRALLEPRPEPKCQFEDSANPDPNADERWKLDYERQCYRQAEMIVRYRLELLQNAARKMIKAVKQTERNDPSSGRSSRYIFVRQ